MAGGGGKTGDHLSLTIVSFDLQGNLPEPWGLGASGHLWFFVVCF